MLVLLSYSSLGQQFFVVQKLTSPKQKKYIVGDEIGVKISNDDFVLYGELNAIGDSSIVVEDQRIFIRDIEKVLDRRRQKAGKAGALTTAASIPFFLSITVLNNWINTGDRPLIDGPTWGLSGVFAGVSLAMFCVPPKKYKVGRKWKVMTLDTRFGP